MNGSPGVAKPLKSAELARAARCRGWTSRSRRPKGTRDLLLERGPEGLAKWVLAEKRLLFTDTTMRDAHQSLLATRVRSHDLLRIAPATSPPRGRALLRSSAGAARPSTCRCASCKEDPWDRLHRLRKAIPNVLFQMLLRGSNAVGYTNYPDNVVERFVEEAAKSGVDVFRVFDALNWTKGMTVACEAVRKQGKVLEAAHLLHGRRLRPEARQVPARLLREAREGARADGRALPRRQGHGRAPQAVRGGEARQGAQGGGRASPSTSTPTTPPASRRRRSSRRPKAGVDVVDAALSSLSGLTAQPNLNSLVAVLAGHRVGPAARRGRAAAPRQLLGDGARVLRALRVGAEERHRRGLPPRDPRRPVLQLQASGRRARPPRQVGGVQGHVPEGEPPLRRHRQGDAVVEGGRRHGHVPREERPRARGPLHREGQGPRLPRVGGRPREAACSASSTAASRRSSAR